MLPTEMYPIGENILGYIILEPHNNFDIAKHSFQNQITEFKINGSFQSEMEKLILF